MEYIKISDSEIKVIEKETRVVETTHDIGFLKKQRESIVAQKERDNIQRDIEIAEIDAILAECSRLNIAEKVAPLEEIIK